MVPGVLCCAINSFVVMNTCYKQLCDNELMLGDGGGPMRIHEGGTRGSPAAAAVTSNTGLITGVVMAVVITLLIIIIIIGLVFYRR